VDSLPGQPLHDVHLESEALGRIAGSLSDLYQSFYDERPVDARASLTGNILAYVFEDGLSVADKWLLKMGESERVQEFRRQVFEVSGDEMTGVVAGLTGLPVTYTFYGFDPRTRTSFAIFVLDLSRIDDSEERRAVLNWSEQVRRNARRLRTEHAANREAHLELRRQVQERRESLQRAAGRLD
jgi:uncharacterized protein YbcI